MTGGIIKVKLAIMAARLERFGESAFQTDHGNFGDKYLAISDLHSVACALLLISRY